MTGRCPECNHKGNHAAFCRAGIDESKPYHGPIQRRPQTSAERYFSLGIGDGDVCGPASPPRTPECNCQCSPNLPPEAHRLGCPVELAWAKSLSPDAEDFSIAGRISRAMLQEAAAPAEHANLGLNPKDIVGATKTPLGLLPWTALAQVAKVFQAGAAKYGAYNWRTPGQPVQHVTYVEAAFRHLAAYMDGQTIDPETGCNHLAHAACGLLILLDASAIGNSIDNRPTPGLAAEIMKLA